MALLAGALCTILLLQIRLELLDSYLGRSGGLSIFYLAVLAAAGLGGLIPGLATAVGSALAGTWWLVSPSRSLVVSEPRDQFALGSLLAIGVATSVLLEALHRRSDQQERDAGRIEALNQQLRRSRERLEAALRGGRMVAWEWDLKDSSFTHSGIATAVLGGAEATARGGIGELVHADDRERVRRLVDEAIARGGELALEFRGTGPAERWLEVHGTVERDRAGAPCRVVGVTRDVTDRRRAEVALLESEQRLALALRASKMAAWDWDLATGEIHIASQTDDVVPGVPAGLFRTDAKTAIARMSEAQRDAALAEVEAALAEGRPYVVEYELNDQGRTCWIETRGEPVLDASGAPVALHGVMWEATERKEAEAARLRDARRLRFLLGNTPLAVVEWDAEMRVSGWSGAAPGIFGYTAEEMLGRGVEDSGLVPAEDLPALRRVRAEMSSPEHACVVSRNRNVRKDGTIVHVVWHNSSFFDDGGRYAGALSLALDVTEQVAATARAEHLVDELRVRAAELAEADRRKDEFLALLAHELRNPLAPMRTGVEVLRRSSDPSRRADALSAMERQVAHMVRLVDDLLDASRIRTGKLRLERRPVDLADVLRSVDAAMRPQAALRGIALAAAPPPGPVPVTGDYARLTQVLVNLVENAVKFTPEGGRIDVSLHAEGENATLRVADTGVGIPPERLHEVFDGFVQLDATLERAQGGLGLGLTLVRTLVELHGGSVRAESAGPGRGSAFTVTLPRAVAAPAPDPAPRPPGAAPLRVLVVDDSPDAAGTLAAFLEMLGHEVETADGGPAALELLDCFSPELVLCDLGMPGMSGLDVARAIRTRPGGRCMRLAALTGYGTETDVRRTREAGFDEHLVKPVDASRLQELLARVARERPLPA